MPRSTNAPARKKGRNKLRRAARGYFGGGRTQFRQSRHVHNRAMRFAWFHRLLRKRQYRRLWITRLSAAARNHGLSYSRLIFLLKAANIELSRKSLSELAIRDPQAFGKIIEVAKAAA